MFDLKMWLIGLVLGLTQNGATPTKQPVAYLYNGVRLPGLPEEWNKKTHPYAYCMCWTNTSTEKVTLAYLYFSTVPLSDGSGVIYKKLYATGDGSAICYYMNTVDGVTWDYWERNEENDSSFASGDEVCTHTNSPLKWANYDVTNHSDGTLYLSASEPVPVYE